MCAGEDRHHSADNSIPDEIREAMNNHPANISIHSLVNEWSVGESVNDLRNFGMELGAKATSLLLVPELRFSKVKFGGGRTCTSKLNEVAAQVDPSHRARSSDRRDCYSCQLIEHQAKLFQRR